MIKDSKLCFSSFSLNLCNCFFHNRQSKEVFSDPPAGARRYLDLVAKIGTKRTIAGGRDKEVDRMLAMIHIEVEYADTVEPLRRRMFRYYEQLRRRHGMPVLPIALYLQVGLKGLGIDVYEEYFESQRTLRFEYLYVGLPHWMRKNTPRVRIRWE